MMILGLISQELHEQLLDPKSYQNRTNGVEELKDILSDLDLKSVPSDSIDEFIRFLHQLLDDSNFKVLYGTLQVINVLIQKLDSDVDRYFTQITGVALKSLGDTHTVTRREYMNVFRQLTRAVGPQKVLDLVVGHLRHKNSRVREDILNVITAAMLTHPRGDFNIPDLCFEVAPHLADSKRKVRHAALELFAVFDYCLDMGKKQPLIKAVDMVELNEDAEGLMAAVQARRARHVLPKLSSEGLVEYALVVPKPGQQCSTSPQFGSGADLDWVLNGGWINSGRNSGRNHSRNEPDADRLYGYGSLGSLTDAIPLPPRIVSAGKGKNKLPWEMSGFTSTESERPCSGAPNGKDSEQVTSGDDNLSPSRKASPETYIPSFGCSAEPQKALLSSRRRESPARLRRSGSLDSDPDIFKLTGSLDTDAGARKSRVLSGSPSVERTFSLPSNSASSPSPASPFLLPSYPLAGACPGGMRTPTLSRHRADSFLSMSNTWPNKRDSSPQQRDPSPWRDGTGDHATRQCSPWPPRASPVSSASVSSFRRALSSSRASLPVSPVLALAERAQSHNGQKADPPVSPWTQRRQPERSLDLDLGGLSDVVPEPQEEDPLDMEEMLNSLRSLRNSAAKKRAKMSLSGSDPDPDPDSPDSAMRLELGLDSPSNNNSPVVTSPASESGLSSLCSPPSSAVADPKTRSPGNSACSAAKPPTARVPSTKLRCSLSMDFSSLPGYSKKDKASPEVGIVGQRVPYSNGRTQADDEDATTTPTDPPVRPTCREPIRALRPAKGCQSYSNRSSPVTDMMPDGVVGKGVFGSAVFSSRQGAAEMLEQQQADGGGGGAKSPSSPLRAVYGHAMTGGCHHEADASSPAPHEPKERARVARCGRDNTRPQRLDWSEVLQVEHARDRQTDVQTDRRRVKQMLSEWPTDDITPPDSRDLQLNGSMLTSTKVESPPHGSPASPTSPPVPQSPGKISSQRHQPSPPTVPPSAKTLPRARRAPRLSGTRPSLSHSSDELSPGTPSQTRDVTESSELRPFSDPELALTQSFKLLSSEDWEDKIRGLNILRSLTHNHSDTVLNKLHDVCLILIQEIKNLRSGVSRVAVVTLGDLYLRLQRSMDQELEATARALLQKQQESNAFIRQHVDTALERMVQHCTPIRGIYALMAGGLGNLNAGVRKCTAQHLATLVEKVGAARLLSGGKDLTDRIVPAVARLAQDSSQEARYFGRRMLLFLSSHRDFDKILEKNVPAKDLPTVRDIVLTLKTKGLGEMPQDAPTSGRRSLPGSGTVRASSLTREPGNRESGRQYSCRSVQHHNISDKTEYIKQISGLLASKDFRERMRGIDQLVADCQHNANMVINSIFPVFDAFKARLLESNSKVNLHALRSLQKIIVLMKDNLSPVVNILVPAIVDNHLNSKSIAICAAANGALDALLLHLDNILLLQPFCTKSQFLSGKAKVDLVHKVADLVTELYPRKPQMVVQKVLPLLWHLLGTSGHSGTVHGRAGSVRGATADLCHALHAQMGPGLAECGALQPANVQKALNDVLRAGSAAKQQQQHQAERSGGTADADLT